jgi:hypothetical protein
MGYSPQTGSTRRPPSNPLFAGVSLDHGVTGRGAAGGNSFVETGIADSGSDAELVVAAGGSLVRIAAEFVMELDGLFVEAGAGVEVSTGWLHPHSDKPTSALAAVIWIF